MEFGNVITTKITLRMRGGSENGRLNKGSDCYLRDIFKLYYRYTSTKKLLHTSHTFHFSHDVIFAGVIRMILGGNLKNSGDNLVVIIDKVANILSNLE